MLLSILSALALVLARSEATASPDVPPSTVGIATTHAGAEGMDKLAIATAQTGLPAATYKVVLPSTKSGNSAGSTIAGFVIASSVAGGTGVNLAVYLHGLPSIAKYGPFAYHIHELAVPSDGNCTATKAHLDPTGRGQKPPCDSASPETCEAGDLAGKHGKITATTWNVTYSDPYLSTVPSSPYYIGNRALVIHSADSTRLACANLVLVSTHSNATTPSPTPGNATIAATPSLTPYRGGAGTTYEVGGILAGGVALVAALFMYVQ